VLVSGGHSPSEMSVAQHPRGVWHLLINFCKTKNFRKLFS